MPLVQQPTMTDTHPDDVPAMPPRNPRWSTLRRIIFSVQQRAEIDRIVAWAETPRQEREKWNK